MKRPLLSLVIISFATTTSFAQIMGGIKGGVNLSKQKWKIEFMGQSASQTLDGVAFHIGGYLQFPLSDVVSLQPELIYNGIKVKQDDQEISLNYLSLPVMFGYGVENNRLIFQGGPQVGVLLSTDPSEIKDDEGFKNIDFSLNFGATYHVKKFNFSFRYCVGLLNITGDAVEKELELAFGEDVNLSIKNNNLQFSVGYRLFGE